MRVAEEETGNCGWREASDDTVEQGGRVWKSVTSVVAGEDMADDPRTLTGSFAGCKLGGEEREDA